MCILCEQEGQMERKRKRDTHKHTHAHLRACVHTQHLVGDSMVFHRLYFQYSEQHHFYNGWWMHPSFLIKAKAKMRRKHLELQSGCTTRQLFATWQKSIQREVQPVPFKWGRQQRHPSVLAAVWNLLWWRVSPFCLHSPAEKTHTLLNSNLKPDTQARRTSPSTFFPASFRHELG